MEYKLKIFYLIRQPQKDLAIMLNKIMMLQ